MTPEFRAWDKLHKRSANVIEIDFFDGVITLEDFDGTWKISLKDMVLEQYTGLEDAKGNKLFEGDILKMHSHVILYGSDLNKWVDDYAPITWDKSMGAFTYQGELLTYQLDSGTPQDGIYHDALELVGNIHENPELLEVE